jgi:hypothetical protein
LRAGGQQSGRPVVKTGRPLRKFLFNLHDAVSKLTWSVITSALVKAFSVASARRIFGSYSDFRGFTAVLVDSI